MSERAYTTIAISKETYSLLLNIRHMVEQKKGKNVSYNDIVKKLCREWGEANGVQS